VKFSERVRASSPVRRLLPYAEEARAKGKKIYPLNIGQPDIKTPPSFLEAIRGFSQEVIAYATSQGNNDLRDAMSAYYKNFDIPLEREDLIVTNGGSEALMFAFMAMCDPGDEVLIPEPFYANYNAFSGAVNVKVQPIRPEKRSNRSSPQRQRAYLSQTRGTRQARFTPGKRWTCSQLWH